MVVARGDAGPGGSFDDGGMGLRLTFRKLGMH
jgi:hypothetical protein